MTKSGFKGVMFEIFCRYLLEESGYTLIPHDGEKVFYTSPTSTQIIKLEGRGSKHQIDLPYDYNYFIPMINPIRIIGEVKFYQDRKKIGLSKMRDFFGVVEDIKENYFFARSKRLPPAEYRKTEQGLFISANGFSPNAQKFAMAHNIKLLSIDNNIIINSIKQIIDELANFMFTLIEQDLVQESSIKKLTDMFFMQSGRRENRMLSLYSEVQDFSTDVNRDINAYLQRFNNEIEEIQSFFFGTSSKGQIMLFVSRQCFNKDIFFNGEANCAIYYEFLDGNVEATIRIIIEGVYEMYSTLPSEILAQFQKEHTRHRNAINAKYNYFSPIVFVKDNKIYKISFNRLQLDDRLYE